MNVKSAKLLIIVFVLISGTMVWSQKIRVEAMFAGEPSEYGFVHMYRPSQDYQPVLSEAVRSDLPESFDWRDEGGKTFVSPVKNQGRLGTCYAFASVAEFESLMLIYEDTLYNFSENNIKGGSGQGDGGNAYINTWYLTRKGYVLEENDPYDDSHPDSYNPDAPYEKRLLGWSVLSWGMAETDLIKHSVMNHGPVWTAMYAGDGNNSAWHEEYSWYDGSYIMPENDPGDHDPNHAVLIVGWNDDFGDGKGGWIVKNSWGDGWGDDGYFYIEYEAAQTGSMSSVQVDWEDYQDTDEILYYDTTTPFNSLGFGNTTAWQRVTFISDSEKELFVKKVGFHVNDVATASIYLYDESNNLLASKESLSFALEGYYTLDFLEEAISLNQGDTVKVVIKHENQDYTFPIIFRDGAEQSNKFELSQDGSNWIVIDKGGNNIFGDAAVRLILGERQRTGVESYIWYLYD